MGVEDEGAEGWGEEQWRPDPGGDAASRGRSRPGGRHERDTAAGTVGMAGDHPAAVWV